MVPQNIAESPVNITSILNNFKSFIKQVHQKVRTQNITKKKDQNNYLGAEISHKEEQILRLKLKIKLIFNNGENLLDFLKTTFIKVNLLTHICSRRNWQLLLILTHGSCS